MAQTTNEFDISTITSIAAEAEETYPEAQEAKAHAIERIRGLPDFENYVNYLLDEAIGRLVYTARHRTNSRLRNLAGFYGDSRAKVKVDLTDPAPSKSFSRYYAYRIGGKQLGDLVYADCAPIIAQSRAQGRTFFFNADVVEKIEAKLKAKPLKLCRNVIKGEKFTSLFEKEARRHGQNPATMVA